MKNTYYIGLDVHKESIAIAHAYEGSRKEAIKGVGFHIVNLQCGFSNEKVGIPV